MPYISYAGPRRGLWVLLVVGLLVIATLGPAAADTGAALPDPPPVISAGIQQHELTAAEYKQVRLETIKVNEGVSLCPYADSKGIPTIGFGFNLRDESNFKHVVNALAKKLTDAQRTQLSTILAGSFPPGPAEVRCDESNPVKVAVDAKMAEFAAVSSPGRVPDHLAFADVLAIEPVFDLIVPQYEKRVDKRISGVKPSTERVALLSLAYASANLLGAGLCQALAAGNRADAWFEIRYRSAAENDSENPKYDPNSAAGIVKRRDFESDLFGLYDGNPYPSGAKPPTSQAFQAISMAATHIKQLHQSQLPDGSYPYNNRYKVDPDSDTIDEANDSYDPAIAVLQTLEGTRNFEVRDLADSLAPATDLLLTDQNVATTGNVYIFRDDALHDMTGTTEPAAFFLQNSSTDHGSIATGLIPGGPALIYSRFADGGGQVFMRPEGPDSPIKPHLAHMSFGTGSHTITPSKSDKFAKLDTLTFLGHRLKGEFANNAVVDGYLYERSPADIADGLVISKDGNILVIFHYTEGMFGLTVDH